MLSNVIGNACFRMRTHSILSQMQPCIGSFSKRMFAEVPRETRRLESDRMEQLRFEGSATPYCFKASLLPEESAVGENGTSAKQWTAFPARECLAVLAAAVSYLMIRSAFSTHQILLSQNIKAVKYGSSDDIFAAVSRIESEGAVSRWEKVSIYKQGLNTAIECNKPEQVASILSALHQFPALGSWLLSNIYQEALLKSIQDGKTKAVDSLLGEGTGKTYLESLDLSRVYAEGLKKAVELNKLEFVSILLAHAGNAPLFNKEEVARICTIGLKRAVELNRSEAQFLIDSVAKMNARYRK